MHHSLQFSDENKSLDESKYSTAASMIIVALLRIKRMLVAGWVDSESFMRGAPGDLCKTK